jgi:hypothetical protein
VAGTRSATLELVDLDVDGDLDVLTSTVGSAVSGSLCVSLGDGAGGFFGPIVYTTPPAGRSLAVGFLNADSFPDAVVAGSIAGSVVVALGGARWLRADHERSDGPLPGGVRGR